jgi:hypothetical protein
MALQVVGGAEPTSGISRLTEEFLYWIITTQSDIEGSDVYLAFMGSDQGKPGPADWNQGELVPNPDNPNQRAIKLKIGASGVDLTPPTAASVTYRVWARIETAVENIVRRAGTLTVR